MRTVGIIAEYNPFHNGHQYHIEKAKELTMADRVVVVMSGNFVQRGTPAIMPKHLRAKAALRNGASLVIELPTCYATGTAEQFAYGAMSILHNLGCVDAVCFGSESGDIKPLSQLASILFEEPLDYKVLLQSHLRNGYSFPAARQLAIQALFPKKEYDTLLGQPNNILGIEYLKALLRLKSTIVPYTIKRQSSDYHDTELKPSYSSATAIRRILEDNPSQSVAFQMPENTTDIMSDSYLKRYPIISNDLSVLLKYRLLCETKYTLVDYADVSEELANRICKHLNAFVSFEQFCNLLKTKEITYSRVSRALLHILLGIRKSDYTEISYARMLGFYSEHSDLLTKIKECSHIPLITKPTSDFPLMEIDIRSANLYESIITDKYKTPFINEYEHPIVRI